MKKLMVIAGVTLLVGLVTRIALAQIDPGFKIYLIENGKRVGEVYVPHRAAEASVYEEHWVLYPGYQYPGPDYLRGLTVKADPFDEPYRSTEDFFRRVPWKNKSKYIHITATESPVLAPLGGR